MFAGSINILGEYISVIPVTETETEDVYGTVQQTFGNETSILAEVSRVNEKDSFVNAGYVETGDLVLYVLPDTEIKEGDLVLANDVYWKVTKIVPIKYKGVVKYYKAGAKRYQGTVT